MADTIIETNVSQIPNYVIISINGSQIYARNGNTGEIIYNSTSALATIQGVLNEVPRDGTVFLRNGTYVITSTILLPSNVIIEGEGKDTVIKLANLANVNIFDAKFPPYPTNITIRNLQIDGNRDGQTLLYSQDYNLVGIDLLRATNSTLENLSVKNTAGMGIAVATDPDAFPQSKIIVRNVIINNTGGDGIYFRSDFGLINNIRVSNYGDTGIVLSRCNNCVLSNSIVIGSENSKAYDGINISRSSERVSIIGNIVQNAGNNGIYFGIEHPDLFSGHDILIDNNLVINSKSHGILLQFDPKNITISNNFILDNGGLGVLSEGDIININGNVVGSNAQYGISVYQSTHNEITNNIIYNNGKQSPHTFDGITIGGNLTNDINISYNSIFDTQNPATQRYGIESDGGSNIHVEGKSVFNNLNNQTSVPVRENSSTKQFLIINGDQFIIPKTGIIRTIKISGYIENYNRGSNLDLTITRPDKSIDKQELFATRDGYFGTEMYLTPFSQIGDYKVAVKYHGSVIGLSFFTVADKEYKVNVQAIPQWIKNAAKWLSSGYISNSDFDLGIEYILHGEIPKIQEIPKLGNTTTSTVPAWIKNPASWWANDLITTQDFINDIEYLHKVGIIQ